MQIIIKIIKHSEQRYETCGDWYWEKDGGEDVLQIRVSDMNNWKYEFLVAFHELAEVILCKDRGISQESVDKFDTKFEEMRSAFPEFFGNREPGNSTKAPYQKEHLFATKVESMMAKELKVDWKEYDKTVNEL